MLGGLIAAASLCRRAVARLGTLMGYVAGWGFILSAAFITFDVIARRFFGFSSQATTELTGYALAFGISWALAHALTMRAHIRIDVLINHLPDRLRYPMHLLSLAALAVFIGFIAKGAWDLVDESVLFRATDISLLRTPLWIPQGLWAFGIAVFLLLILLMFVESLLLVLSGRGREAEALRPFPHLRGGGRRGARSGRRRKGRRMIAILFLLVLVGLTIVLSLTGAGPGSNLIWESLLLVVLFCVFFGAGIYVAAALGVLGLIVGFAFSDRPFWNFLGQTVWGPSSSFVLVAVPLFLLMGEILLRAGLSERLYRALNVWLDRLPGGLLHTNIAACGVFSAISGSSVATAATMGSVALPFFHGTRYDPKMVLGLARRGRRARQPDPARHHLHHLRADHRNLGQRALPRGGRPEPARRRAVHSGDLRQGADRRAAGHDAAENPAAREAQDRRRPASRPRCSSCSCSARSTAGLRPRPSPPRSASSARSCSPRSRASSPSACSTRRPRRPRATPR